MDRPLDGKYILVTGATSGMGKVTARRLAEQGATVVIVGRNPDKTAATVQELQRAAPHSTVLGIGQLLHLMWGHLRWNVILPNTLDRWASIV